MTDEATETESRTEAVGQVDPLVIRHSEVKCSYKCRYYQDGPVFSYCNKYHKPLKYDGTIPPLLTDECKAAV